MEVQLAPGTMVGGFRVESKLGEGGMGAVYACVHPVIGKRAAAKVIHESAIRTQHATERFIQEARLVNAIRHPNLVDVFGFATFDDGRPVLIMELLEGETLRDLLERDGRLAPTLAIDLTLQVLDGLGAAHLAGVVHRDLKPDNLFVVPDRGGGPVVKILDFGIAKLLEPTGRDGPVTGADFTIGTPEYMSPEQCRGSDVDGRSDLYAVGIILFEMLVGGRPFHAVSAGEYVGQHLYVAPPRISDVQPSLDPALAAVVEALLEKSPEARPPTAQALTGLLRSVRSTLGAPARSDAATLAVRTAPTGAVTPRAGTSAPTVSLTPLSAPAEENRLCTVVFVEVIGLVGGEVAAEDVKDAMDACLGAVAERIERRGGHVDRVTAEGLMAAFGIPRSTDNDAERAVLAALELGGVARRAAERAGSKAKDLALLVGVETGVVFSSRSDGRQRRLTIAGEPVTVASSLASGAEPNAVLVGRGTYRHVSGLFEMRHADPVRVRGTSSRIDCHAVIGPLRARTSLAPRALHGRIPKFVGRRAEIAHVLDAVERSHEERRACLLTVVGAAGIGKSRILEEVNARVSQQGSFVFVIGGRAGTGLPGEAYQFVADLVRDRFRILQDDPDDIVDQKLRRGLRWLAGFQAPRVSALPPGSGLHETLRTAAPLEVDPEDVGDAITTLKELLASAADDEPAVSGDAASSAGQRVASALAKVVGLVAMKAPVLVLCDDLQAADDASLDVLDYLVTRLGDAPVAVVGFARPDLFERRPHWGEGREAARRLDLAPLSERQIEELARDHLSRAGAVSEAFVARLVERVDRNPLMLEECLRMLVDAKVVETVSDDVWRVNEDALERMELPPTVYGVVQSRLDRLSDDQRVALQRAAVVGRTFWRGVLEELCADEPVPNVSAWLDTTLAELRARDLVHAREASSLPGEREFVFADALVREVSYAALARKAKEEHHRRVAHWLEGRGAVLADANPALLALHHDRGGNAASAFAYFLRAGRRAARLGQNLDALSHYLRARELSDVGHAVREHDTEPSADHRLAEWRDRTALSLELGDTLRRVGRLDDAAEAYEAARSSVVRDEHGSAGTGGSQVAADALVDFRLGLVEKSRGAHAEALTRYRSALARLGETGHDDVRAEILVEIGFAQSRAGDVDGSLRSCRLGLAACQRMGPQAVQGRDVMVRLLYTMGVAYYHQKKLVRAERFYRQGARLARRLDDPHAESVANNNLAAVAFERGDFARARDLFLLSLRLKERIGDLWDLTVAHNNLAEVALHLGDPEAALHQARRALELVGTLRARGESADVYRNAAEAYLAVGRADEALAHAERALALSEDPSGRVYLGASAETLARCAAHVLDAPGSDAGALALARTAATRVREVVADLEGEGRGTEARRVAAVLGDAAT